MSDTQKEIYVGNLPVGYSKNDLRELFESYGEVTRVTIPQRGEGYYGFVHMSEEQAEIAINTLNNAPVKRKLLTVNYSKKGHYQVPQSEGQPGPSNHHEGSAQSQPNREHRGYDDITEAKVYWCLQSVMTDKSFGSAEKDVKLFPLMFSNSQTAQEMKMHPGEIADIVVHAFGPYFTDQLLGTLKKGTNFVLGFHQSLDNVSQKPQMDLTIRFWDRNKKKVCTRYLTSGFLQNNTTSDFWTVFTNKVQKLHSTNCKILQISTDEPREDFELFRKVQNAAILDVGSCVLHTINYAFKAGINGTGWKIDQFLQALYDYFGNNSAHCENFKRLTSQTISPEKFREMRWLENESMTRKTLEIFLELRDFVDYVVKKKAAPSCAESFGIIEKAVHQNLFPAKLAFFATLASDLVPFMKEFQTDTPMIPFLHSRSSTVLSSLMKRFVKSQVLEEYSQSLELVDVEDEDNLLDLREIDLGPATKSEMNKMKKQPHVSEDLRNFQKNCKTCLIKVVTNLRARLPINSQLIAAVSCFNPFIAADTNTGVTHLEDLLEILKEHDCITDETVRQAKQEYVKLCSLPKVKKQLQNYRTDKERLDCFWNGIFKQLRDSSIAEVMRMVMVLSHGNTHDDSGFSVDMNLLLKDMPEEILVARRITYDAVSASGGISNFPINKSLARAVRNVKALKAKNIKEKEEARKKEEMRLQESEERKAEIAAEEVRRKREEEEEQEKDRKRLQELDEERAAIHKKMKK